MGGSDDTVHTVPAFRLLRWQHVTNPLAVCVPCSYEEVATERRAALAAHRARRWIPPQRGERTHTVVAEHYPLGVLGFLESSPDNTFINLRERERTINPLTPVRTPTGDQTHALRCTGRCPNQGCYLF